MGQQGPRGRERLTYLSEFRLNWPSLLGAGVGLALGVAINHHMTTLFGPALLAEFGWTKSQFALTGSLGLIAMFVNPVAGRIIDRYGPRVAAMIGFSVLPTAVFSLSLMTGSILQFYAIMLVAMMFGILTATAVFSRVVVERFDMARGIALACMLSFPPLVAAVAAPIIGGIIETEGWRTAYRVLALTSACGGLTAILLIGRIRGTGAKPRREAPQMRWADFRALARRPVFLFLLGGMFLCNLPQVLVHSQMNLMLMENGATMGFATLLVSAYAISVVIGRLVCGLALDRIPAHLVAIIALGLPTVGYLALASSLDARWLLAGSIVLVGLAQGAETDVGAYLTSRRFDMDNYAFVFSLLMMAMGLGSALGSVLLSLTLHLTDSFDVFLMVSAAVTGAGALSFFLTGHQDKRERAAAASA
jgi:MFS family permease